MKVSFSSLVKFEVLLSISLLVIGDIDPTSAHQPMIPVYQNAPGKTNFDLFLPVIQSPGSLFIGEIELSQAIQNLTAPVKLVAGRPTVLRIYARSNTNVQQTGVTASVKAFRDNTLIGQVSISNGRAFPLSISLESMQADKVKSIVLQLPSSWITEGSINLQIQLTGPSTSLSFSYLAVFHNVPALNVVAVPIRLNGDYEPADTTFVQDALFRMYPVPSVTVQNHLAISFNGNLNNYSNGDWQRLLDEITALRDTEASTNSKTVYYGVIPLKDSEGYTWFSAEGGVVGLGWLGYRASIGISNDAFRFPGINGDYKLPAADTAAHEIGHNFGRFHTTGCGATNIDEEFPYSNGIIGQYGFQYSSQTVIPSSANDIMNYCSNQWISDYTYNALIQDQLVTFPNFNSPVRQMVYIRGGFETDNSFTFQPFYEFETSIDSRDERGLYSIRFIDENGGVISEHPVSVHVAQEKEISSKRIHSLLPKPEAHFSSVEFLFDHQVLSTRKVSDVMLQPQLTPGFEIKDKTLLINWGESDVPVLFRMSQDDGRSWTTLAVDNIIGNIEIPIVDLPSTPIKFQMILADGGGEYFLDWRR